VLLAAAGGGRSQARAAADIWSPSVVAARLLDRPNSQPFYLRWR
jgi:hypothetical protein